MKKNILVVKSLLVLPLLTSSLALGMEKHPTQKAHNKPQATISSQEIEELQIVIRKNHSPLFAELKKHFEDTPTSERVKSEPIAIITPTIQLTLSEIVPTIDLALSETEIINVSLPIRTVIAEKIETPVLEIQDNPTISTSSTTFMQEAGTERVPNLLLQSVMLPTEEKPLTWSETFTYYTSTSQQILRNVIKQLEDNKFDIENARDFKLLDQAIQTATANSDFESLATIATLCHEKYPTTVRISEDVAQAASQFLHAHYTTKLSLTNAALLNKGQERRQQWNIATSACLKTINDAINTYNQEVKTITNNYDNSLAEENDRIKNLRREISTFSSLNREIRHTTAELLSNKKIELPTNILAKTMNQSTQELNSIVANLNRIPKILEFEPKAKKNPNIR